MQRHRTLRCALVQFVHGRCGVFNTTVRDETSIIADGIHNLVLGDTPGLTKAITEHQPAVIRPSRPCTVSEGTVVHNSTSLAFCDLPENILDRIRSLCGHRSVDVRLPAKQMEQSVGLRITYGDASKGDPYVRRESRRLDRIIDSLKKFSLEESLSEEVCYAAHLSLRFELPELCEDFGPLAEIVATQFGPQFGLPVPGTPSLYLGAGAQQTPLHMDPTENMTIVLQGSKKVRLFPPVASSKLKPRGGMLAAAACWIRGVVPAVYSDVDAWTLPDSNLCLEVELQAGDILYLPCAWWHAVAGSVEPNVSISFGYSPSTSKGARHFQRWLPT